MAILASEIFKFAEFSGQISEISRKNIRKS